MHANDANLNTNKTFHKDSGGQKLIYPDLSYVITGICFDVHNEKGRYCREKQYADALEEKFAASGIEYRREFRAADPSNIFDFIVEDKIILEIKAKPSILKIDYIQLQRYLQSSKKKLGLLVNFRNRYIKPIRVVRIDTSARKNFYKSE